jgi:hypothetical protein
MSRVKFLESITQYLKNKCPRVYSPEAPEGAKFPYLTYDTPTTFDMSPGENIILEIDIWDDKQDTTALENLMEAIDGNGNVLNPTGLNRATFYVQGSFVATLYKDEKFNVPDADKKIKRRQLRYECKIYYEN